MLCISCYKIIISWYVFARFKLDIARSAHSHGQLDAYVEIMRRWSILLGQICITNPFLTQCNEDHLGINPPSKAVKVPRFFSGSRSQACQIRRSKSM